MDVTTSFEWFSLNLADHDPVRLQVTPKSDPSALTSNQVGPTCPILVANNRKYFSAAEGRSTAV